MDDHIKESIVDKQAKKKLSNLKAQRKYYAKKKDDPEFKLYNKTKQKQAYQNNANYRQKKIDHYNQNKDLHNFRSMYNKYKREKRIDKFIERHPDKYEFLIKHDRSRYEVTSEPTEPTTPAVAPE